MQKEKILKIYVHSVFEKAVMYSHDVKIMKYLL